jgi:hypothetical protein
MAGNQRRSDGVKLLMTWRARGLLFACVSLLASVAFAQVEPAPSFEASRVLFVNRPVPLAPGLVLSIFGANLGPSAGCVGNHDEKGIYPQEICRVRVLVGGIPSELLWVQAGQINFKVPKETPTQGTADLVVVYQGQSSKAVTMPLGVEVATLSLESPARVGMPVWLKLKAPYDRESGIRYPFMIFPASFGCNEVEVRRNGVLLPRIADVGKQAFHGILISGNPCGWLGFRTEAHFKDRFPLHLQYRFDQPGTYEVRLTERRPFVADAPSVLIPWTKIEILPADARARQRWLADKIAHAPKDAADLLTDFLPSILGNPDEETLRALRPYLYHRDRVVREYAMYGLTYWPADQVGPKIWQWIRAQGPSDATVDFFLHLKEFSAPHAAELAEVSIPYLQSNSAVLVYGALRALSATVLPPDSGASPDLRARAGDAMIRAADHILPLDPENTNQFIADVGQLRDERSHGLLWDLVNRHGPGFGQALSAITWRKSPPDLPKLAQLTLQPANGHSLDYEFSSLPSSLHHAYGDAALPYLDTMLERSEFTRVRTDCARELILANRPEGFAFFADAIANNRPYRQDMIQFVRDQFPELRQADDPALLKFVQARAVRN